MNFTLLVYLWLVAQNLMIPAIIISGVSTAICFFFWISDHDTASIPGINKEWAEGQLAISAPRLKKSVSALACACVVASLIPGRHEVAILVATYTASSVAQSPEAGKAMDLLRLYIGKELDAEIAKLKADK